MPAFAEFAGVFVGGHGVAAHFRDADMNEDMGFACAQMIDEGEGSAYGAAGVDDVQGAFDEPAEFRGFIALNNHCGGHFFELELEIVCKLPPGK